LIKQDLLVLRIYRLRIYPGQQAILEMMEIILKSKANKSKKDGTQMAKKEENDNSQMRIRKKERR